MSTDLNKYLVCLATEPDRYSEFVADPRAALENAGLSEEDRAILLTGDQNTIYTALVNNQRAASDFR